MISRRACLTRLGRLASPLAVAALLPGCGFRPAYMPAADGEAGTAQREMAAVFVDTIPERSGQLLRQALQERFERTGPGVQRRYRLSVSYGIGGEGIGILPDTSVTRIRLIANADWYLIAQNPTNTRLAVGHARAIDGFNVLNQQYFFGDLSNDDAQRRLATAVADQIAIQVAAWFRGHPPATG